MSALLLSPSLPHSLFLGYIWIVSISAGCGIIGYRTVSNLHLTSGTLLLSFIMLILLTTLTLKRGRKVSRREGEGEGTGQTFIITNFHSLQAGLVLPYQLNF